MMEEFVQILGRYKVAFLALHVLAMAVGLGGATVSDLLFFKFLSDDRISKKEVEVLHILKNLIVSVMLLIVITGFFLYLPQADVLSSSAMFRVKTIVTFVLVANGVALHLFIAPHLIHLNFRAQKRMSRSWSRLAFALGAVSVTSWYTAFFIAMLKKVLPFGFHGMLGLYLGLLTLAVTTSQLIEWRMAARGMRRE